MGVTTPLHWTRKQLLGAAAMLLATAYFALWACGPMESMVAMPTMIGARDNARRDSGIAGSFPLARQAMATSANSAGTGLAGGTYQLWGANRFEGFDAGLVIFGYRRLLTGIGGFLRGRVIDSPTLRLSRQFSAGLQWWMVSVPVAYQFSEGFWVYTAPSMGRNVISALRLPIGLAVTVNQLFAVHVEGQISGGNPRCGDGTSCSESAWSGTATLTGSVGLSFHQ